MYDLNIREEIFGATMNNIKTGKRDYITKEELNNILCNNEFYSNSVANTLDKPVNIRFTPLKRAISNHFSFADIVFIELTRECNLRCAHCLNSSGKKLNNQLNLEEVRDLIVNLASCGLQEVRLTGGEPLLFNGIFEIIKLCKDNGLYVSIGTNGTLITEEVALKLKESGLDKAVVSIDGNKEYHDKIRGKNNYNLAMDGLKNLKNSGIKVRINSVIMKSNMYDIISFAKNVHNMQIPMFIRRFIESGRGEMLNNNMLSAQDYEYVKEQLSKEIEQGEYVNGHYLRNDEGIHSRIELPFEIKGCKAGQRAIAIMPDGEIHLCGFLAGQGANSVGNVRNINNWLDFWDRLQKKDMLLNLRNCLTSYNSIPNVQKTYCLAYVQRYINKEKKQ